MASAEDDLPILLKSQHAFGEMSVEDLQNYIEDLKSEIIKAENIIKNKKNAHTNADRFFKS